MLQLIGSLMLVAAAPSPAPFDHSVPPVAALPPCMLVAQDYGGPCWSQWWNVLVDGVDSGLTMSGAIVAIEACGATIGLSCAAAVLGINESVDDFDQFMDSLQAMID